MKASIGGVSLVDTKKSTDVKRHQYHSSITVVH